MIMLVTIRHLPRRLTASPTIIRGVASSAASFSRLPSSSSSSELLAGNGIVVARAATTWRPTFIVESSPSPSSSPPATSISSWREFSSSSSSSSSSTSSSSLRESYNHILVERRFPEESSSKRGGVGIITLHRPKALNALCDALFDDLIHAVKAFDDDDTIGCIVVTGSGKAFAAGADISEMSKREFADVYKKNMFAQWADITQTSKPIIAAVNGFALGGGCELAMMCDILLAGSNAQFGQPEINLGVIPGAGGTQRLIRAVGKSKAMEMVLTGNRITAQEAMQIGLASKVIDSEVLLDEAVKMGLGIAEKGGVAVRACKETVNAAEEMTLSQGLKLERRMFHALFATKDQKEGMLAFLDKRKPNFTDE